MEETCFSNENFGMEKGFPELEKIIRLEIPTGKISDSISLKEDGFCFKIICLRGVCVLYPEKVDFRERKHQAIVFQPRTLDCQNLPGDFYFIANRGEDAVLALILKIKINSFS